jgi:hypothetical protein
MEFGMNVFLMYASWLLTALCSVHVGAIAMGWDFCAPYHRGYQKYIDMVYGVAGVVSLAMFVWFMANK